LFRPANKAKAKVLTKVVVLFSFIAVGCKERGPGDAAAKCEALLSLICAREADCELASNHTRNRATMVADCRAVFDCSKAGHMSGPYEECRNDIASSTCAFIKGDQRSLVSFILDDESPLASCNRVVFR